LNEVNKNRIDEVLVHREKFFFNYGIFHHLADYWNRSTPGPYADIPLHPASLPLPLISYNSLNYYSVAA
jgi:hypothetical protein